MSPIERYLGMEAMRGPVDLLGLHSPDCTQSQVLDALRVRLARIGRHPQGRSVEADEVRLALHAAAAQLLDPRVRAHMLEPGLATDELAGAGAQTNGTAGGLSQEQLLVFRQNALELLVRSGGWNRQSMQYVAGLAHASGIPLGEVSRALHRQGPSSRPAQPGALDASVQGAVRRAGRRRKKSDPMMAIVGIAGGIGVSLILGLGLYAGLQQPVEQRAQHAVVEQSGTTRAEQAQSEAPGTGALHIDASNVLETFVRAQDLLATDTGEAGWRFARGVEWLATNWYTLSEDVLAVVDEAVRGFLEAVPEGSAAWRRAVEAMGAPANEMLTATDGDFDVAGAVWSIQFLQAARQDRGLPIRLRDEAVAVLMRVFSGRIDRVGDTQGIRAGALRAVLERIVPEGGAEASVVHESIEVWRACARTLEDARVREGLVIEALSRMLVYGPSISQQRAARDASLLLLGDVSWGPAGLDAQTLPGVAALLGWFANPLVPTAELSVVTQWFAHGASGPGVSTSMILARAASESTRATVRDRYAAMWAEEGLDTDSPRVVWRTLVAEHLSRLPGRDTISLMDDVARGGELEAAAVLLWSRQHERALRTMERARVEMEAPRATVAETVRVNRRWMVLYVSSNDSLQGRLDALRLLEDRQGLLTQGEGDFLAELALVGSPLEVRRRAQWIVRGRRGESQMLLGILEALPENRWRGDAVALLEEIAEVASSDPGELAWRVSVRKGVIEKLLDALAREEPMGQVERSVGRLTGAMREQLGETKVLGDEGVASADALLDTAQQLRQRWELDARVYDPNPASPVSLDGLRQRRISRSTLAQGPIQLFAVEQLSLAELLAFVLIAERPDASGRVQDVLERLFRARSRSGSSIGQINAAQRAILHLWWIRHGFGDIETIDLAAAWEQGR